MLNIKNIIFAIAICILTMFVGIYGISTLYGESPRYDNYCPYVNTQAECDSAGGTWISYNNTEAVKFQEGYCQYDYTSCQNELESAQQSYYKKVFFTAVPIGVIIILIGALVLSLEAVSAGLMLGGVGMIIYGTGSYWRFTDDWLKFLISLAGLVILIWAAYWFNSNKKGFIRRFFVKKK